VNELQSMDERTNDLRIEYYVETMHSQVIDLFEMEYGTDRFDISMFMENLYDTEFQKDRSIRLVALSGQKVVGFQSFFLWPYERNGVVYNSYQSGNSIVHPDFRGRGIFQALLNYIFTNNLKEIDFFIGFPVEASCRSFLKCNWKSILDLQWYVNVVNPFFLLYRKKRLDNFFSRTRSEYLVNTHDCFTLSNDKLFLNWKDNLKSSKGDYYFFDYKINGDLGIVFELKYQKRKYNVTELIIGKIDFFGDSIDYLNEALTSLLKLIRRSGCIAFCSISVNPYFAGGVLLSALANTRFFKINKKIHFIVKAHSQDFLNDIEARQWNVGRSDIDTW
jgi:GNAT superfamily N-acetyltransferase